MDDKIIFLKDQNKEKCIQNILINEFLRIFTVSK